VKFAIRKSAAYCITILQGNAEVQQACCRFRDSCSGLYI
jgi:hypothetical protein